jgi:glyoxylate reductase
MRSRRRVVVGRTLPNAGLDLLRERFTVETGGDAPEAGWLLKHAPGAVAIIADPSIAVDMALLDAAGDALEVVANFGVGSDNIDLDAVCARGVRATNTPDVVTGSTAEIAVALMLAAGRRIAEADAIVRAGTWVSGSFLGRDLSRATVGLVGFGRIGQEVAKLLQGFDTRVLFYSRTGGRSLHGAQAADLPELLAASDFVSIHVPLTSETRHLIDERALALMKPGAILVNSSRGGVVDTDALVRALRSKRLGAAGLDVYEDEPYVPAALRECRNTVLLPHIGSATVATRDAMARLCAENVIAVIDGREPPTPLI